MNNNQSVNNTQLKRKTGVFIISMVVVAVAFFTVQFHRNTPSVMRDELIAAFGMSGTSFGLFSSMYFYPYMIAQIPIGMMLDSLGARKTIGICSAIAAGGALLFGVSNTYVLACVGRVLIGIGVAAPVISTQTFLTKWFGTGKTASIYGVFSFIGKLGGVFAALPLAFLVEHLDWRMVFFISAALCIIIAVLCFFVVKDSNEEAHGIKVERTTQKKSLKELFSAMGHVLANKYIWMMMAVMFIHQSLFNLFSSTWAVPYLQDVFGLPKIDASAYTTCMSIGSMAFCLVAGFISDKMKSRSRFVGIVSVIITVMWVLLGFCGQALMNSHMLWPVMFIMGIGAADVQIMFAYSREMNDPQYIGVSVSTINMIGMLGSAIMPTVFGSMLDKWTAAGYVGASLYRLCFIPCIILAVISAVLAFASKETYCRNRFAELHSK